MVSNEKFCEKYTRFFMIIDPMSSKLDTKHVLVKTIHGFFFQIKGHILYQGQLTTYIINV